MNALKNLKKLTLKQLPRMIILSAFTAIFMLYFAGCQSVESKMMNDRRTIPQLIEHLRKSGLKIDKIQKVRYQAILASDGRVMVVDGANVEFYTYDVTQDYQKEKLEKIKKHGSINILGYKIPAITNGKFIMLTYSENPNKALVIRAFKKF